MLPNSIEFYLFLSMLLVALAVIKNYQTLILLMGSAAFIVTSQFAILPQMLVILITYYGGYFVKKFPEKKRILLALIVFGVLTQLALFKYLPGMLLPLGISYYSFMALGYVIDVYRGKLQPTTSLIEYVLFVSFFPVITSGPIIRARDFFAQIKDPLKITSENFQQGLTLITIGLIMKLVIADNLALYVDPIFANPMNFQSRKIILATLAFGVQLYFDFGGYSNIALGTARVLGFKFPMNFNNPYFAMNPQDFWHRWNISLSCWLRDYLYIPLGGNRKGEGRTYINLMITMLACGLWHGATWNFLLWGGYHGVLLSLHRLIRLPDNRILSLAGILVTQYLIFFGWLVFKVSNINNLEYCLSKFLIPTGFTYVDLAVGSTIIAVLLLLRTKIANNNWMSHIGSFRPIYWFLYLLIAINLIYWASPVKVTKFIYSGF
ncbi:MBOAT family protein [Dehalococcoides sp.]|jgi:D-alanyl-lipoteichoic acid acyltransferase DltB (MBOAT superfamily)|uniref:MBOAT family O-acyltransferase n=1 Tax=Dehalococcoides sp. TaxID=1966486 RepID=UPI003561B30F